MTFVSADEKAKQQFTILVTWQVYDTVTVQAHSLEEAFDYVRNHLDDIPLGDDESYAEGSYEISADDPEGCLPYQPREDVVCTDFFCEEDLEKYVDSILFDPTGRDIPSIAHGTFAFRGKTFEVQLDVCGEVALVFRKKAHSSRQFNCREE